MNIIRYKKIFLGLAVLLTAGSVMLAAIFGFKEGIDFSGGTLWQLAFQEATERDALREFFVESLNRETIITEGSRGDFLVRLEPVSEEDHQAFLPKLREKFGPLEELSFQSIGPSVGSELRRNALIALALVLLGISAYIAFVFRKVSEPVSSWKYGVITLLTLFHDIAIPAGLYAVLSRYAGVEVDTNFIVALLVVMGFSVHDTIVVFDRIRENLLNTKHRSDLDSVVNKSVNETFARSLNTSLTLVIVLIGLYILGPQTLKYFVLTMLVGVLAGTYSSIFVASPLLTLWHGGGKKR